jgi:malate dehydrogenase
VVTTTDAAVACEGVDIAVMVGGFPRKAGMERKDVMTKNVTIYAGQAAALEKHAAKGVKVGGQAGCLTAPPCLPPTRPLCHAAPASRSPFPQVLVVANPANTNAIILKEYAPSIPAENITCMTRLDHNRALAQVAGRCGVHVTEVCYASLSSVANPKR